MSDRLRTLSDHLEATEELPVRREASAWLGEAAAVAADVANADLAPAVVDERVEHVRRLLSNVETTGHPEADDHVAAARRVTDEILRHDGDE